MRLLTFIFLLLGLQATAQFDGKITYQCSYYGENAKYNRLQICLDNNSFAFTLPDYSPVTEMLDRILAEVGLPRNFLLVECPNIDNCKAVNIQAKKGLLRYIIYDDAFLKGIDSTTNTYWASVSIFAHEIAHHLSGHTLDSLGSRPDKELEADRFSGFILFKLGATLEQAQAAMNLIGAVPLVSTHPPLPNRLAAIRNGWNDAWQSNYRQKSNANQLPSLNSIENIARELYDKAYLENTLGRYEDAVKSCNTAIYLKPGFAEAYCQRGLGEANLLLTQQAIKSLDTAISLKRNYTQAMAFRGRAYAKNKQYALATIEFMVALRSDSLEPSIYAERAQMRLDQGLYDKAIDDAAIAVALDYKDIHIPLGIMGYAYFKKKNYTNAYGYFLEALDYNPVYEFARKWGVESYKMMQTEKKAGTPKKNL